MTAANRMSASAYRTLGKPRAKAPKYGNKKVTVDGVTYDSQREARRWGALVLRQRAGEIRELRRQVRYPLTAHGAPICVYVGDFEYEERADDDDGRWELVTEDAKGFVTDVFKLKAKMFEAEYGRPIRLT